MVGYAGYFGSGKTCFMTDQLFRDHLSGRFIVTNYTTSFSNLIVRSLPDFIKVLEEIFILKNYGKEIGTILYGDSSLKGVDYKRISIGLDEAGVYFESRNFSAWKDYPYLIDFLLQCRKLDVHIYYTVQHPLYTDVNFRRVTTDWFFFSRFPFHLPFVSYRNIILEPDRPNVESPLVEISRGLKFLGQMEVWGYYDTYELAMKYPPDSLSEDYALIASSRHGPYFKRPSIFFRLFPTFLNFARSVLRCVAERSRSQFQRFFSRKGTTE